MQTMRLRGMVGAAALAAMMILGAGNAHAGQDCRSFGGYINTEVDDDVFADGITCKVGPRGVVSGDLTQTGAGGVVVEGVVEGDVTEEGAGDVMVTGLVYGKIDEKGDGRVGVTVAAGRTFEASIFEQGNGGVSIAGRGGTVIKSNVNEDDDGGVKITLATNDQYDGTVKAAGAGTSRANNLTVLAAHGATGELFKGVVEESGDASILVKLSRSGLFEGNIIESGPGSVESSGSVKGSVTERDDGNLTVTIYSGGWIEGNLEESGAGNNTATVSQGAELKGNVIELGAGDLSTRGGGTIIGNSEHELPGACSNSIPRSNFIGDICKRIG